MIRLDGLRANWRQLTFDQTHELLDIGRMFFNRENLNSTRAQRNAARR